MFKKIFITFFLILFSFSFFVNANDDEPNIDEHIEYNNKEKKDLNKNMNQEIEEKLLENKGLNKNVNQEIEEKLLENKGLNEDMNQDIEDNINSKKINSDKFEIKVSDFVPGGKFIKDKKDKTSKETVDYILGFFIQKLMITLGSIALVIMTVGAGHMIIFYGQDELLSKGKSIFIAGITSLIVALSSYYLISLIRYILYSGI